MTREEALVLARKVAAAVCELDGCSDDFCNYMRDGSYDDHREVQAALAAAKLAARLSRKASNVVEIAA